MLSWRDQGLDGAHKPLLVALVSCWFILDKVHPWHSKRLSSIVCFLVPFFLLICRLRCLIIHLKLIVQFFTSFRCPNQPIPIMHYCWVTMCQAPSRCSATLATQDWSFSFAKKKNKIKQNKIKQNKTKQNLLKELPSMSWLNLFQNVLTGHFGLYISIIQSSLFYRMTGTLSLLDLKLAFDLLDVNESKFEGIEICIWFFNSSFFNI